MPRSATPANDPPLEPPKIPDWSRETASDDRLSPQARRHIERALLAEHIDEARALLVDEP